MATNINNISLKDLVFMRNREIPTKVFGCKNFTKSIAVDANITVDRLNDESILEKYKKSVLKHANVNINGSLVSSLIYFFISISLKIIN